MNDNQKRKLGIVLFVVGILIAISAGAKVPEAGDKYPTTVGIFLFGLILGIAGNLLWHKTQRKIIFKELEEHKNDSEFNPVVLLESTPPAIKAIQDKIDSLNGEQVCEEVDKVLDQYVHPFTQRMSTFTDLLGKAKGAEILLIIAYAERMLNRVWSAASDGYPDEAKSCLADSLHHYEKALGKLPKG